MYKLNHIFNEKNNKTGTLKSRFVVGPTALACFLCVIMGAIMLYYFVHITTESDNEVAKTSMSSYCNELENELSGIEDVVRAMAMFFRMDESEGIMRGRDFADGTASLDRLYYMAAGSKLVSEVFVIYRRADGQPPISMLYSEIHNDTLGQRRIEFAESDLDWTDMEDTNWFDHAVYNQEGAWLKPEYSERTGRFNAMRIYPLLDEYGQVRAVIGVKVDFDRAKDVVDSKNFVTAGTFAVDSDGNIYMHDDYADGVNLGDLTDSWARSAREMLESKERSGRAYEITGVDTSYNDRHIRMYHKKFKSGIHVFMYIGDSFLRKRINRLFAIYAGAIALGTLLSMSAVYLYGVWASRPLADILNILRDTAEGAVELNAATNRSFKRIQDSRNEIGEIARRIYYMRRHLTTLINDTVRRNKELTEANDNALKIMEAMRRTDRNKSLLLGKAGREISISVNEVIMLSDKQDGQKRGETADDRIGRIHSFAEELLDVVNDIYDFMRLETGDPVLHGEPYSPSTVLEEAVAPFRTRAEDRGIIFLEKQSGDFPEVLEGDYVHLKKIIEKLVSYVIRCTVNGSVSIETGARVNNNRCDIYFSAATSEDRTRFSHHAEGAEAEPKGENHAEGAETDLSLALVRRTLEHMGSSLGADRSSARGSRYYFTLRQRILDPGTMALPGDVPKDASDSSFGADAQKDEHFSEGTAGIIDFEAGLIACDRDTDRYIAALNRFYTSGIRAIGELKSYAVAENRGSYEKLLSNLEKEAEEIGAAVFAAESRKRHSGGSRASKSVFGSYKELNRELNELLHRIKDYIEANDRSRFPRKALERLYACLRNFEDEEAGRLIREIEHDGVRDAELVSDMSKVRELIINHRQPKAAETVSKWLK